MDGREGVGVIVRARQSKKEQKVEDRKVAGKLEWILEES